MLDASPLLAHRQTTRCRKAAVAVAHNLLVVIWWLLHEHVPYNEMGPDYLARFDDPARRQRHLVHQLEQLGLTVTIEHTPPERSTRPRTS